MFSCSGRKNELITGHQIQMNIYNGKNKMRREINSKMLKKGQQKSNMRLCNGVIIRERIEYKGHHHVQKLRAFCKGQTVTELALTPLGRTLRKSRFEVILRHNPQTLTTKVVKELYPRNPKHIRNKLQCDKNARTSNANEEKRY